MDIKQMIEQANKKAAEILTKGRPVWVDVQPAGEVIPGMTPDTILIAGPPIAVEDIPLPVKNAICGALLYEQRAETAEGAWQLVTRPPQPQCLSALWRIRRLAAEAFAGCIPATSRTCCAGAFTTTRYKMTLSGSATITARLWARPYAEWAAST